MIISPGRYLQMFQGKSVGIGDSGGQGARIFLISEKRHPVSKKEIRKKVIEKQLKLSVVITPCHEGTNKVLILYTLKFLKLFFAK